MFASAKNRRHNTVNLKRLVRERRRKEAVVRENLQGVARRCEEYTKLLERITSILNGEKQKTVHWNRQLSKCKERIVKKRGPMRDAIDLITDLDEKTDRLARLVNSILVHTSREESGVGQSIEEIGRLKISLMEFVNDTLEELNQATIHARTTRFEDEPSRTPPWGIAAPNPKKKRGDDGKEAPASVSGAPNVLVTTMFRLYDHNRDTDIADLFKKKKKSKKKAAESSRA